MVRSRSLLSTPPSLLLPTPPFLMLLPTSSTNPSRSATTPGCPSDLPLLIYNLPSMACPSRLILRSTLPCVTSSSPLFLIPSLFSSPKPASSIQIGPPVSTIRNPFGCGSGPCGRWEIPYRPLPNPYPRWQPYYRESLPFIPL